jgi:hypothetical protein
MTSCFSEANMQLQKKKFSVKVPVKRPKNWKYDFSFTEIGDVVTVVPEPDNIFDENALKLNDTDNQTMGYVPADLAAKLAPRLLNKSWKLLGANVVEVDLSGNWSDVWVEIKLEAAQG